MVVDFWPNRESPQSTIYFKTTMAKFLDHGQRNRPITQIEPNVFRCGDIVVIMRHWSEKTMNYLTNAQNAQVIYFIDDDVWCHKHESPLRSKFQNQLHGRISRIVSPLAQILSHFPDLQTLRLDPTLIYPLPSLDHHDNTDKRLEIGLCTTGAHLRDLEWVCDELSNLLNAHRQIHLTTFFGDKVPENLRLDNCTHRHRQFWPKYRKTVETLRFHIGIAPWRDIPTNRGRSCTRILDHAAFGAAGLYSAIPPFSDRIDHGHDGMLVSPRSGAWAETILELANDRRLCRQLAAHGQKTASRMGDPVRGRAFWCAQLGL